MEILGELNVIHQYFTQPNPIKILIWLSITLLAMYQHGAAAVLSTFET